MPYKLIEKFFAGEKNILNHLNRRQPLAWADTALSRYCAMRRPRGFPHLFMSQILLRVKSNMMLGKKATRIFVASDGMEKFFPADRLIHTGNPVRKNVVANQISREEGLHFFGLDPGYTTVLITGGSLGAKSMNEAIDSGIPLTDEKSDSTDLANRKIIFSTGRSACCRIETDLDR